MVVIRKARFARCFILTYWDNRLKDGDPLIDATDEYAKAELSKIDRLELATSNI